MLGTPETDREWLIDFRAEALEHGKDFSEFSDDYLLMMRAASYFRHHLESMGVDTSRLKQDVLVRRALDYLRARIVTVEEAERVVSGMAHSLSRTGEQ